MRLEDAAATLGLGAYLIGVGRAGKGQELSALVQSEGVGFARWAGAGLLLGWIVRQLPKPYDDVGTGLLTLAAVSVLMTGGKQIFEQVEMLFNPKGQKTGG